MPELPEVEHGRRVAERVAAGRRVSEVWCDDDPIVFDGVRPEEVREALLGARVLAVHRRGKHLWFELDRRPWPLFHFGMTGAFRTPTAAPLQLASSAHGGDAEWPPRFAKLRLELEDGGVLVMTNKRRLGRIRLRHDPPHEPPISELGFDPWLEPPSAGELSQRILLRQAPLKSILLDQAFAAGIGNWLADEILYGARLHPLARPGELTQEDLTRLRDAMVTIVAQAVAANADKERFPSSWLFHRRWGRSPNAVTEDGHPVAFLEVGGRTTAWVPAVQPLKRTGRSRATPD